MEADRVVERWGVELGYGTKRKQQVCFLALQLGTKVFHIRGRGAVPGPGAGARGVAVAWGRQSKCNQQCVLLLLPLSPRSGGPNQDLFDWTKPATAAGTLSPLAQCTSEEQQWGFFGTLTGIHCTLIKILDREI